jgi:hypothetical protein
MAARNRSARHSAGSGAAENAGTYPRVGRDVQCSSS